MRQWGYFCRYNKSDWSDSFYLNINLGTREQPQAIHLRIADHASNKASVRFAWDICGSRSRTGAVTYIKFLIRFAEQQGFPLPFEVQRLQPGTLQYKRYAVALQRQAA
jgi:hypothetical protein